MHVVQMAELRWGVIGLQYRPVDCSAVATPAVVNNGEGSRLSLLRIFQELNLPSMCVRKLF